jgi:hypothetical protein
MVAAAAIVLSILALSAETPVPPPGETMVRAANDFLNSLGPEQRIKGAFEFENDLRFRWEFLPAADVPRQGIAIEDLNENQRKLAHIFLQTGLSQKGYLKATMIFELENVLREIEGPRRRNPERYYFSIFGKPSIRAPWGWRVEGHHLSLNFTVVSGTMIASAPRFMGANPAEVRDGPHKGLRVLVSEEDLARELMNSMDEAQRREALFRLQAFRDIVTNKAPEVSPLPPVGIPASRLTQNQLALLTNLVTEYISAMPDGLAFARLTELRHAGIEQIRFGWAGNTDRGQPHYYRVQGPTFLIEYDNTQNNANHIHSVWRDFDGDFGRDLLREHYRSSEHQY